jgi:hypothetical protein
MEVRGQLHGMAALFPGKEAPGTHWIGGWMDPSASVDAMVKKKISASCQELKPRRPARSLVTVLTELPRSD